MVCFGYIVIDIWKFLGLEVEYCCLEGDGEWCSYILINSVNVLWCLNSKFKKLNVVKIVKGFVFCWNLIIIIIVFYFMYMDFYLLVISVMCWWYLIGNVGKCFWYLN